MKRYILTGTPGSGKTSLIRKLKQLGYATTDEAATDIINHAQLNGVEKPWHSPSFIDDLIILQLQRASEESNSTGEIQFNDRSPFCTYALALYLKIAPSTKLLETLKKLQKEQFYEKKVFFIENLGFIEPTAARTISFDESLYFERLHEEAYIKFGFELVRIKAGFLEERIDQIIKATGK